MSFKPISSCIKPPVCAAKFPILSRSFQSSAQTPNPYRVPQEIFNVSSKRIIPLIPGDGIGPEIAASVEGVFWAADVPVIWEKYEVPVEELHWSENFISHEMVASIARNQVALKGPLFTPIRGANVSHNLRLRKALDLFSMVVPCVSMPGLKTRHDNVNMVIVRENTEGEYTGFEQEVVSGVVQSVKIISRKASLRIAQYAFEYARAAGRKKVTAVHKANIQKLADGEFLKACRDVSEQYKDIQYTEMIVDNTCMQLVQNPQQFDVLVTPNLYGNIVTNIATGLVGGPGILPGANIGIRGEAIFEPGARHVGRDIQGKNLANPTALLQAAILMLRHINLSSFADRIEKALLKVIADGKIRTKDIGGSNTTNEFTKAVISNL